ncbi:MAG: serine/threonine-protein kinase [Polyangiales bacterium]
MAALPGGVATEVAIAAGFAGKLVAGRYKLETLIGAGAVGEVWLAEHIHMRKRYALKLVDQRYATPEIVARFEREAQAAANVSHQGIAHATDFGRDDDGSFFLVLEYIQGHSLRAALKEGALSIPRSLDIAKQILAALGAAHKKNVIHRDLKPENLMLAETRESGGRDVIKILDFGIAKVDRPGEQLTRAGTVYGTPAYMSPEQALGQDVDARADLWAVGAILFELLTGSPPFPGEGLEVLAHVVNSPVPPPSQKVAGVTPEIDALVLGLLEKEREKRPANVAAALALMKQCEKSLAGEPASVAAAPLAAEPGPKSKRTLYIAAGAIAVLIVLPLLFLVGRSKPVEEEEAPRATKHVVVDPSTTAASIAVEPSVSASAAASASASASAAPSVSVSASASASVTKKWVPKKNNEHGFGKLKSLFK